MSGVVALVGALVAVGQFVAAADAGTEAEVVVPRGQPVQIAFVGSSDFPDFTNSFRNATAMAIEQNPTVKGHAIELNEFDSPCFSGDFLAANATTATTVVANPHNAAVLGQVCSQAAVSALPICEAAGMVTISGSASASFLPALAPTVFDRTIVVSDAAGDAGDLWLSQIAGLPPPLPFRRHTKPSSDRLRTCSPPCTSTPRTC